MERNDLNETLEDLGINDSDAIGSGRINDGSHSRKNANSRTYENETPEYDIIMSYKRHLETLVVTGRCKEFLGKHLTLDDLDKMNSDEIKKWYNLYVAAQGSKLTNHLNHTLIKAYSKTCSHFFNIDDEDKLVEDLNNDFLLRNELSKWGGYLALKLGPTMSLISTSLITFSHIDTLSREQSSNDHRNQSDETTNKKDENLS